MKTTKTWCSFGDDDSALDLSFLNILPIAMNSPIPAQDQVNKAKEYLKSFLNLEITGLREIQRYTLFNDLRILEKNTKSTVISNLRDQVI